MTDYAVVAALVAILLFLAAFWSAVGFGIYTAVNGGDHPHVVCFESAPRPHIGTAIVCKQKP